MCQYFLEDKDISLPDPILGSASLEEILGVATLKEAYVRCTYTARRSSDTRSLAEISALGSLAATIPARRIFEIGTFVGRTTHILAHNAKNAEVFTLDLPGSEVTHQVGEFYRDSPVSVRVHQLTGDSLSFDFSPWRDSIDFCWVDANHDYDFVKADTIHAFEMIRTSGWIGWHDYRHSASWSGVTQLVRQIDRAISHTARPRHLFGTTIALCQVTEANRDTVRRVLNRSEGR
jgi:SAM-dependent methyltransferase